MLGNCEIVTPHWGTKRMTLKAGLDLVKCSKMVMDGFSILVLTAKEEMYRKWENSSVVLHQEALAISNLLVLLPSDNKWIIGWLIASASHWIING